MQRLSYEVTFLTPAFLGNAEQRGQWRTPPFKAALRHWWRVVWACRNDPSEIESMRRAEGRLFGAASNDGNSKSRIRLRLSEWKDGTDNGASWLSAKQPDPLLYLGYGPLDHQKRKGTVLKHGAAIQAGDKARLELALAEDELDDMRTALALLNHYGTLGGRSRNGWGSVALDPCDSSPSLAVDCGRFQCDWRGALDYDWAHAIGKDDKALIWTTTNPSDSWHRLMKNLAKVRKDVRPQNPQERRWLAYPVTRHDVKDWRSKRLPNSLRFKVRRDSKNREQLRGVIFHMPCLPPAGFDPRKSQLEQVWQKVHEHLDSLPELERTSV